MLKSVKRAIISVTSALGIKPVDRTWLTALARLEGSFGYAGSERVSFVFMLTMTAGITVMLAVMAIKEYREQGRAEVALPFVFISLGFLCLFYLLLSRLGLRYEFRSGRLNAFNTWGRLMWSEDLAGLKDVTFFSGRGTMTMTLFWPNRRRAMVYLNSLRDALDTSVEQSEKSLENSDGKKPEDGVGPSWVCPACREENPGSFEECWKCQRLRSGEKV